MSSLSARISLARAHERPKVGSRGRAAGAFLPVGRRSSNGSIAGAALTYRSPDLRSTRRRSLSKRLKPCARYGRCARLVQRPSIRKATDNGSALGPPGSPSRLGSNPGQSADAMSALFIGRDHVIVAGVDNLHFLGRQIRELILEIEHALRPEAVEHGNLADCPRSESRADAIARCRVEQHTGDIGAVELIPIGACWLTSERC